MKHERSSVQTNKYLFEFFVCISEGEILYSSARATLAVFSSRENKTPAHLFAFVFSSSLI